MPNLQLADKKARRGKGHQPGIVRFDKDRTSGFQSLHQNLISGCYATSEYTTFKVFEPKERLVYRLPYAPDRIAQHAAMNLLEPIFVAHFTADTYSCIKGRGIHGAARNVKKALRDLTGTTYCLKLDIRKFYPSIDHDCLKDLLKRKFKDQALLQFLGEIIDSAPGLPIGNYLSQYLSNFYLSYFDHWIKEDKKVKYYFRYADDIVILAPTKSELHQLLADIRSYLALRLKLEIKSNYQVFPVEARGIDFVGYRFFHTHTLLRKSIKQNCARKIANGAQPASVASYWGWMKHANCKNLALKLKMTTVIKNFGDFNIQQTNSSFVGEKIAPKKILGKNIVIHHFKIEKSKIEPKPGKTEVPCTMIQIELNGEKRVVFSSSRHVLDTLKQVPLDGFPFMCRIMEQEDNSHRLAAPLEQKVA
jgi:hypothetical protein